MSAHGDYPPEARCRDLESLMREAYPLLRKAVAAISYDPTLAEMEVGWTDEIDRRADDVLARMKAALGEQA